MNNFEFAENMKARTKMFAVEVVKFYKTLPRTDEVRVLGRQVLRSGTSVAANYRAVCRAKSPHSKLRRMNFCACFRRPWERRNATLANALPH